MPLIINREPVLQFRHLGQEQASDSNVNCSVSFGLEMATGRAVDSRGLREAYRLLHAQRRSEHVHSLACRLMVRHLSERMSMRVRDCSAR